MSYLELLVVALLVLTFLSTPFAYRWARRPRVGKERKYLTWYKRLAQTYTAADYELAEAYRKELIVWFDDPVTQAFYNKASELRTLLKEKGRSKKEAPHIWKHLLEKSPNIALCLPAEKLLETYDLDAQLESFRKDDYNDQRTKDYGQG